MKTLTTADLNIDKNSLVVVAEAVEKPGNLGALLRTCDGAGVDAVILTDSPIDFYGPQTIRSSLGAVFTVPLVSLAVQECLSFLKQKDLKIVAADPHSETFLYNEDLAQGSAIILGSEADGLSSTWHDEAKLVKIPMHGVCDSLNVSVAGAVMIYEALRQRQYK